MSADSLVPRDCRPKGRSPSLDALTSTVLPAEGNEPSGRPPLKRRPPEPPARFLLITLPRITNTRVTGYRTLAALASDSPPRRPLLRPECQDPARPNPPGQAATALGAPRVPATKTRQPSSCTRFAPPPGTASSRCRVRAALQSAPSELSWCFFGRPAMDHQWKEIGRWRGPPASEHLRRRLFRGLQFLLPCALDVLRLTRNADV